MRAGPGDPDALKFFYADRRGSPSDGWGPLTGTEGHNASFAAVRFIDAKTAEVDIIDRFGCVVYRYTKRNPNRLSEAELAEPLPPSGEGARHSSRLCTAEFL